MGGSLTDLDQPRSEPALGWGVLRSRRVSSAPFLCVSGSIQYSLLRILASVCKRVHLTYDSNRLMYYRYWPTKYDSVPSVFLSVTHGGVFGPRLFGIPVQVYAFEQPRPSLCCRNRSSGYFRRARDTCRACSSTDICTGILSGLSNSHHN